MIPFHKYPPPGLLRRQVILLYRIRAVQDRLWVNPFPGLTLCQARRNRLEHLLCRLLNRLNHLPTSPTPLNRHFPPR